jgi:hypothetical protein
MGFAVRDTYRGTLADGTALELHEWDYVWTNEDGHINRWDWFVDSREWYSFLAIIGLDPKDPTYQSYTVNFLREGASGADAGLLWRVAPKPAGSKACHHMSPGRTIAVRTLGYDDGADGKLITTASHVFEIVD